jgi:hypothetical protein
MQRNGDAPEPSRARAQGSTSRAKRAAVRTHHGVPPVRTHHSALVWARSVRRRRALAAAADAVLQCRSTVVMRRVRIITEKSDRRSDDA